MAFTVIECEDKAQLDAYKASQDFLQHLKDDFVEPRLTEGTKNDVEVDADRTGTLHYLIIEDKAPEDNVTLRLDAEGVHFWATGVEI